MMNSALVVVSVSCVRVHWRQFHRRQVTPASSAQTTSPGSGWSMTASPEVIVSNGSEPGRADAAGRPHVPREVLAADRHLVQHADGVVEVGQAVDAGEAVRDAPQQRLEAVAGALGLRAERPVGVPPVSDVGPLLGRAAGQECRGCSLGFAEPGIGSGIGGTARQAVRGEQGDDVVRPEGEDRLVHRRSGDDGLEIVHGH